MCSADEDSNGHKPMRVLHLAGEYPPFRIGGIATYLENLVRHLYPDVISTVHVMLGTDYQSDPPSHLSIGPAAVEYGRLASLPAILAKSVITLSEIRALVELPMPPTGDFDLVHAHDWYGVLGAILQRNQQHIPMVMTSHLPLRYGFTYSNHPIDLQVKMRLESLGFRVADRILAPSGFVKDILTAEYHVPPTKVHVIHNGVDYDAFSPEHAERSPESNSATLLTVGRLTEQKGLDHLLRIFRLVYRRLPDCRLLIAGDGPYRSDLMTLCREAGLAGATTMLGYVPHAELPGLYQMADVFVTTSVFEPFGMTTLEAMACATPVVASSLGGAREFVRDGLDGFLRPPQDHPQFASAILRLLRDKSLRRAMGARARRQAEAFGWRQMTNRVLSAYRDAVSGLPSQDLD